MLQLHSQQHKSIHFFWKPHMEKLLGVNFEAQGTLQIQRRAAAAYLTSRIMRLAGSVQESKYGQMSPSISQKVIRHRWHCMLRKCVPLKPSGIWIAGGATYSYIGGKSSTTRCRWWRAGFNPGRARQIHYIEVSALKYGIELGYLPAPKQQSELPSIASVNSIYMT